MKKAKKEKEKKEPRTFVPSKRIKNLHRNSKTTKSLKEFAKSLIGETKELCDNWLLNKMD